MNAVVDMSFDFIDLENLIGCLSLGVGFEHDVAHKQELIDLRARFTDMKHVLVRDMIAKKQARRKTATSKSATG